MPQPVFSRRAPSRCVAEARERAVHLTTGPLAEDASAETRRMATEGRLRIRHSSANRRRSATEGLLDMVKKRYRAPTDDLIVIWLGRQEQLPISLRDARESLRDYDCLPYGGRAGGWIDSEWAESQGIPASLRQGAVAAYKIFPADAGRSFMFVAPRWLARLLRPFFMRRLMPPP